MDGQHNAPWDPAAPEHPEPTRRHRRWRWWYAVPIVVLLGSLAGATLVSIPYYAIAPGSAVEVSGLVEVTDGPSFPPEGKVYLTTVSLREVSLFEAVQGWLDPAVDVVERQTIDPDDVGSEELRRYNLRLMEESKDAARGVAFEQLGYDAISGTGARIVGVIADTPADGSVRKGETLVAIDREPVRIDGDAIRILGDHEPGDRVNVELEPVGGGPTRSVDVRLGENPDGSGRAFLGVGLETRDLKLDFPYRVDIASERIGGPSAGLAFTLELLDVLTDGELTGGRRVAATGTIELDGSVGEVGGVAQKTVAVEEAGVELFLVPRGELDKARSVAGDDLRVEPVDTLEDALRILADVGGNGLALGHPGADGA